MQDIVNWLGQGGRFEYLFVLSSLFLVLGFVWRLVLLARSFLDLQNKLIEKSLSDHEQVLHDLVQAVKEAAREERSSHAELVKAMREDTSAMLSKIHETYQRSEEARRLECEMFTSHHEEVMKQISTIQIMLARGEHDGKSVQQKTP